MHRPVDDPISQGRYIRGAKIDEVLMPGLSEYGGVRRRPGR